MLFPLLVLSLIGTANAGCSEYSTAHPPPVYDLSDAAFRHALAEIDTAFETTVADPKFAETYFSVEVTSSKESLWSKHHTAQDRNASRPGAPEVNGDALYRIASISKTFTVLGILYQHKARNLSLDASVSEYIEELREKQEGSISWKDITLRSLASQLSGIPREFAQVDLINNDKLGFPELVSYGLPPVSRDGLITCDEYSPNYETPCTAGDLLNTVRSQTPVFAPNIRSTYSNVAFELLGLALARVANQSYESYIDNAIFKPLDMQKSRFTLPPDDAGVIPMMPHFWDVDLGIQKPTGGIYSSTNDLSKYLRYVLTQYNDVTHAVNWMHPVSPTRGLHSFYGMPWEIFRTDRILKASRRPIDFITKGGGLPGYSSLIIVIPEYNLGITLLVAGDSALLRKLQDIVTVRLVRAAEALAAKQVQQQYVGTYASTTPGLNTTMTLVADDERGLVVTKFISNGTDFFQSPLMKMTAPEHWYAQLVPTLLNEEPHGGEIWRMLTMEERDGDEGAIWDDFCVEDVDRPLYAAVPLNKMVFWDRRGERGAFGRLELPAFRVNLTRVEEEMRGGEGGQSERFEL